MGFEAPRQVGLVEKASKIALKFHVTYSIKRQVFDGDADNVAKAAVALERWMNVESSRVFRMQHE